MPNEFIYLGSFLVFIIGMLGLDLGVFNKKDHEVSLKEALIMSIIWVSLALGFFAVIYFKGELLHDITNMPRLEEVVKTNGHTIKLVPGDFAVSLAVYRHDLSLEFITGYVVEYALSVDNIFVIVLIFTAFGVEKKLYHRVLFWGILGAVVMRFIFIFLGAALIAKFGWILYLFGAFLVYSGVMMFRNRSRDDKIDTQNHKVVRWAQHVFAVWPHYDGNHFLVKKHGKTLITPLFIVLLVIEFTDLIFAVDSIPAIFAVTQDAYIVFFSNVFAILGLRSMFFLLVNIIHKFHYLKIGLSVLLIFVGIKMLAHDFMDKIGFETLHSLIIILLILTISVIASLIFPKKEKLSSRSPLVKNEFI